MPTRPTGHVYTRVARDEAVATTTEGRDPDSPGIPSYHVGPSLSSSSPSCFPYLRLFLLLIPSALLALCIFSPQSLHRFSEADAAHQLLVPATSLSCPTPVCPEPSCPDPPAATPAAPCPVVPAAVPAAASAAWGWAAPVTECPLGHVDLFLVLMRQDLPLVSHLARSLEMFMPCYGHLHLFCDEDVEREVHAWLHAHERVRFHRLVGRGDDWDQLADYPGYLLQQLVMMWADQLVAPTAEYVMFFDTDVILTLPVTCSSLFDEEGRPYMPYWTSTWQTQYYPSCKELVHEDCSRSFMAFLPLVFPVRFFAPFRLHLQSRMESVNHIPRGSFNGMLAAYFNMSGWRLFSQFIVMGNYQFHYEPDTIHPIHYPMWSEGVTGEAHEYIPVGLHYGWIPCRYLQSCPAGVNGEMFRGQMMQNYSTKYGELALKLIQELLHRGRCMTDFARTLGREGMDWSKALVEEKPMLIPRGCTAREVNELHLMVPVYPESPPDMKGIYQRYAPMQVPGPKCSAHRKVA